MRLIISIFIIVLFCNSCRVKEVVIGDLNMIMINGRGGVQLDEEDIEVITERCFYYPKEKKLLVNCIMQVKQSEVTFPQGLGYLIVKNQSINDTVAIVKDDGLLEGKFHIGIYDTLIVSAPGFRSNYYQLSELFEK